MDADSDVNVLLLLPNAGAAMLRLSWLGLAAPERLVMSRLVFDISSAFDCKVQVLRNGRKRTADNLSHVGVRGSQEYG